MSMIKLIPPPSALPVEVIKVASVGLVGADFRAFVKRAGHPLADWVRRNRPAPGEVWTHGIAMSATEVAGCNRNADGYTAAMLRRDHPTFEKHARLYRNHVNRDPARSYGYIPKAYYNPDMQRVELICAWNGTKEAADRNGGLVAEATLGRLESGRDIDTSMATKIPYDTCVACHNRAPTRASYCGPERCTKYGGCRDNLGKTFDDGFVLFVDNPHCDFYDYSDVSDTRGADRTSFITGKVATPALETVGGARAAELLGLETPDYLLEPHALAALKAAADLAAYEARLGAAQPYASFEAICAARGQRPPALPAKTAADGDRHQWLSDAAHAGLLLPPAWWLAALSGTPVDKCAAFFGDTRVSPAADLLARPDRGDLVVRHALAPALAPQRFAGFAPSLRAEERLGWKLAAATPKNKAYTRVAPPELVKAAAAGYAAYQANVLAVHANSSILPLIAADAVRHNRHLPR